MVQCQRTQSFGGILDIILLLEFAVVAIILVYLSFKNSRIVDPRFREEGQSVARFGLAAAICIIVVCSIFIFILFFETRNINGVMILFWTLAADSTLTPLFLFSVVLIPKVS